MVDIVPVISTLKEIDDICSEKKVNGKRVTGFNVWAPEVVTVMETICDGHFLVRSFRYIGIRRTVLPEIEDQKKQRSKMSRILKKLV